MKKPQVTIYSDGSIQPNPGDGGWGAVVSCEDQSTHIRGGFKDTTVNRMEMMGIIQGLSCLSCPCDVNVFTDSQYVSYTWSREGPLRAVMSGKSIANGDLWGAVCLMGAYHVLNIYWVRGHTGIQGNDIADTLAMEGRLKDAVNQDPGCTVLDGKIRSPKVKMQKYPKKVKKHEILSYTEYHPYWHTDFFESYSEK